MKKYKIIEVEDFTESSYEVQYDIEIDGEEHRVTFMQYYDVMETYSAIDPEIIAELRVDANDLLAKFVLNNLWNE